MIEAARSPFERYCLLQWTFLEYERALANARSFERVVHCRYCGQWHLTKR
jgi:hypothetical protein